jgi:aryl-alcohol dehydrogenase-like predicted oxidoreductase
MNDKTCEVLLGNTNIKISPIGLGLWSWGDNFYWGYGRNYSENDLIEAFEYTLDHGINFFDTAEVYGNGQSEKLLGKRLLKCTENVVVATKFMPFPWRLSGNSLIKALKNSLKRLGLERVDLYQIHWPLPPVRIETWCNALAEAFHQGLVKAVGVSNFNPQQMRKAISALAKHDIMLSSNQVEYHILNRHIELSGLLDTCKDNGITLIAYSPLAQGLLTGKYSSTNPPKGIRSFRWNKEKIERIQPIIRLLREIGELHDHKTPSQVALNWVMAKGAIPIPGAKNGNQAHENAGALGWSLTPQEVKLIDQESENLSR